MGRTLQILQKRAKSGPLREFSRPTDLTNARRRRVDYPVLGRSWRTVSADPAGFRHEALFRSSPDRPGAGDVAVPCSAGFGGFENVHAGFPDAGNRDDIQVVSCAFVHDFVGVGVAHQATEAYPSPSPMSRWLLGGLGNPVEGSCVNCPAPIRLITSRSFPAGRCCPVTGRVLRLRRPALWPSAGGVPRCRRLRPRRPGPFRFSRPRSSIGPAGPVGFRSPG